jgi:hypothetical protein
MEKLELSRSEHNPVQTRCESTEILLQDKEHELLEFLGWVLRAVSKHRSVHLAYNPYFSACFFSRNSIFLSQQISQQCFSAGLSAQPNGATVIIPRTLTLLPYLEKIKKSNDFMLEKVVYLILGNYL